jgi:hypothetical protein
MLCLSKLLLNSNTLKAIFVTIFILLFKCTGFTQVKLPVYIFGIYRGGYDGNTENHVLQFFTDSTFTITNYKKIGQAYLLGVSKIELKGKYTKLGDTFILSDSASKFYPFVKESNNLFELVKNAELRLFPAKIILEKDKAQYVSYLGIPIEIKTLRYTEVAKIEEIYYPHKMQTYPSRINSPANNIYPFSPQVSNKHNSF